MFREGGNTPFFLHASDIKCWVIRKPSRAWLIRRNSTSSPQKNSRLMKKNTRWLRALQETSVISARITIPRDPQTYMENVEVSLFREKREREICRCTYITHVICIKEGRMGRSGFSIKRCRPRDMTYANISYKSSFFFPLNSVCPVNILRSYYHTAISFLYVVYKIKYGRIFHFKCIGHRLFKIF